MKQLQLRRKKRKSYVFPEYILAFTLLKLATPRLSKPAAVKYNQDLRISEARTSTLSFSLILASFFHC